MLAEERRNVTPLGNAAKPSMVSVPPKETSMHSVSVNVSAYSWQAADSSVRSLGGATVTCAGTPTDSTSLATVRITVCVTL